ncbi:AAA family ATPase, partial [Microcoleus sp.]|uniref:AAA family ATPase n=1 Tax=Microcoleus sp. TaxID=44472 RepID=UPI00403E4C47
MIGEVRIENYKSIQKLKLELGRVTVLIGENGCGKSNILEAIALASAAADDKLDNEFLASRGIRVTEPQFMRSAFERENLVKDIKIELRGNEVQPFSCILQNDNSPYSQWVSKNFLSDIETSLRNAVKIVVNNYGGEEKLRSILLEEETDFSKQELSKLEKKLQSFLLIISLNNFIIYSPENQALRTFEKEGQIQPLGINGEGLFKLLKFLSSDNQQQLNEIKKKLQLIDWFQDFEAPPNLSNIQSSLQIKDR